MFILSSTINNLPISMSEFDTLAEAQKQMFTECANAFSACCDKGAQNIMVSILDTYSTVKAGEKEYFWNINEDKPESLDLRLSAAVADTVTRVLEEMGAARQFDTDTVIAAVEKVLTSKDKPRLVFDYDADLQEPQAPYLVTLEFSVGSKKTRTSFLVHARSNSEAESVAVGKLLTEQENLGHNDVPDEVNIISVQKILDSEDEPMPNTGYYRVTMSYTLNGGKERYDTAIVVKEDTPTNASYAATIDLRQRVEGNVPGLTVTDLCIDVVEMVEPPEEDEDTIEDDDLPDFLK